MSERELVAKWRKEAAKYDHDGATDVEGAWATSREQCADELEALINAPVGGEAEEAARWHTENATHLRSLVISDEGTRVEMEKMARHHDLAALALRGGEQTYHMDKREQGALHRALMAGVEPVAAPSPEVTAEWERGYASVQRKPAKGKP